VEPDIDVVFMDTGYHFRETLETAETVRRRYGLALRVIDPPVDRPEPWQLDPDSCCSTAKVAQLDEALVGKAAWISGLRRAESPTRADAPIVTRDRRGLIKVNPLANWTDADVERYIAHNDVPVNPLLAQGYPSIGCWPCTRPVCDGEHQRAGRWTGSTKSECGLHL
jgi:phosphoadenosine phosphosulfate reductase